MHPVHGVHRPHEHYLGHEDVPLTLDAALGELDRVRESVDSRFDIHNEFGLCIPARATYEDGVEYFEVEAISLVPSQFLSEGWEGPG